MKFYAVYRNADCTEGRGPMIHIANFKHYEQAKKFVEEMAVNYNYGKETWMKYGNKVTLGFFDVEEKELYESEYDVEQEKISKALNKLSSEEINLLHKHFRKSIT